MDPQNEEQNTNEEVQEDATPQGSEALDNETSTMAPEHKSVGPMVGIIVIVILLILGGFYFWGKQLNKQAVILENEEASNVIIEEIANQPDQQLEALNQQSVSDEIADIEADLSATDLEGLDSELDNIDLELNI